MDTVMLGKRIREARRAKKMTQEQLAEAAEISQYYLGEIERGDKIPSLKVFVDISDALEVSTDSLLRDSCAAGSAQINNEITKKLGGLTPKQRVGAVEILNTYINSIKNG